MSKRIHKPAGTVFPNLNSTLGTYDPAIQCIFLDCANREDLEKIKLKNKDYDTAKKSGVLIHEIRHYTDHISTLWGHKNILSFQAAGAAIISQDEHKLVAVIDYMKQEYRIFQEKYYQETYNQVRYDGTPWGLNHSTGLKFSADGSVDESKPIIFARFQLAIGRKPICRVPITISSLLEVNAVSNEINYRIAHMTDTEGDNAPVHIKTYQDDFLNEVVYNQQLAVYNVAAHIVANNLKIKSITKAYSVASKIATVTLNMPDAYLNLIPIPEYFRDSQRSYERIKQAVLNNDAGAIFLVLTINYTDTFKIKNDYELEQLLTSNNLPSKDNFSEVVFNEMLLNSASTGDSLRINFIPNYYVNLLAGGTGVFRDRGIDGGKMNDGFILQKHSMFPNLFVSDSEIPEPLDGLQHDVANQWSNSPAFRYYYAWKLKEKMADFFEIRGL